MAFASFAPLFADHAVLASCVDLKNLLRAGVEMELELISAAALASEDHRRTRCFFYDDCPMQVT